MTELPSNIGQRMWEQIFRIYVLPEIERRQEAGAPKPFPLLAGQIVFHPDGRGNEIRLNDEIKAEVDIRLASGTEKQAGDEVLLDDIGSLHKVKLLGQGEGDCGHITFIVRHEEGRDRVFISFDARWNRQRVARDLQCAEDFLLTAQHAAENRRDAPLIDNLYSAAELAARSMLLLLPDPDFSTKKTNHKGVHRKFNWYAKLGNTSDAQRDVFNKLAHWRYGARYGGEELDLTDADRMSLVKDVRDLVEMAQKRAS